MKVKVVKINPEINLPKYQTSGSAGMDIHSNIDKIMKPGEIFPIATGLKFAIPSGYELQIRPRSGLAKKGLSMPNAPGTIDSDYRGELFVLMINFSKEDFEIKKNDRIAQAVLKKHEVVEWEEVDNLDETEREDGAFGSTGV